MKKLAPFLILFAACQAPTAEQQLRDRAAKPNNNPPLPMERGAGG